MKGYIFSLILLTLLLSGCGPVYEWNDSMTVMLIFNETPDSDYYYHWVNYDNGTTLMVIHPSYYNNTKRVEVYTDGVINKTTIIVRDHEQYHKFIAFHNGTLNSTDSNMNLIAYSIS